MGCLFHAISARRLRQICILWITVVESKQCVRQIGGIVKFSESGPMEPCHTHLVLSFPHEVHAVMQAVRPSSVALNMGECFNVPRCGPLGGIYTALQTTRAQVILFLACDMPFITTELMQTMAAAFNRSPRPLSLC